MLVFDFLTSCFLVLQKALSEMQTENQQRLKEREQELKELKKVMDVMQVGWQTDYLTEVTAGNITV